MGTLDSVLAAGGQLGTGGVRAWLLDNIVPLLLLGTALMMLLIGAGKGDNAGVMRRVGPVLIALAVVGFAVTNSGVAVGTWLAGLFTH